MKKRYHIIFSGTVQGVGFRYTARALALKYKLTGWVMNLPTRDVELEVEGEEEKLDSFLEDLKDEFKGYIRDIDLRELDYTGEFKNFDIRF